MNRNSFLIVLLSAFVVTSVVLLNRNSSTTNNSQRIPTLTQREAVNENLPENCRLTPQDSEGPYYIANVPFRDNLAPEVTTQKLVISGKILYQDCVTPLAYAILDIWHADENGDYQDELFRGKVKADRQGNYKFTTILPSPYGSGAASRPRHIHYKVFKEEEELLTSQMYFDSELVAEVGQTRIVELTQTEESLVGEFNIFVNEWN